MDGDLSFIEIGVDDAQRGRAFYDALFGGRSSQGRVVRASRSTPTLPAGMHDGGASPVLTVPDQRSPAEPAGTPGGHPSGTSHSERPRLQPSATDRVP